MGGIFHPVIKWCSVFLILFIVGCTGVFFQPSKDRVLDPGRIGISYEEFVLKDGEEPNLVFWKLIPPKEPKGTLLFFHGNAENMSTHLRSIAWLSAEGYEIYTLDYRGYGGSEGEAEVDGVHADALRALKFVMKEKPKGIVLYGQSLGASLALWSAAQPEVAKYPLLVIAESPFSSYREIVQEKVGSFWLLYPFQKLFGYLVRDDYSAIKFIQKISSRVVLIHGESDRTGSIHHSEILCKARGERCEFWRVPGADHLGVFNGRTMRERMLTLLASSAS